MEGDGEEQQEPGPRAGKREDMSVCLCVCICVSVRCAVQPCSSVALKTKWRVCGNQMNPLYKLLNDQS